MPLLKSAPTRFGLRVALPALVILFGTIATVVISLDRMADAVNRVEDTLTERSTEAAISTVLRRIGQTHRDYAEWDDAARRLYGTVDPQFVSETFDSATETQIFFDTAYILDEAGQPLARIRIGKQINLAVAEAFSPAIDLMLDGLATDGRTYEVRTGLVQGPWGLAAVAAGPIVPSSSDFDQQPSQSRYLILAKDLNTAALDILAEEYVLRGLRFAQADEKPTEKLDLIDPTGRTIATLTWPASTMGSQAYSDISPAVMVMLTLIGLTMIVLIVIAVRGLKDLKRGEEQARFAAAHDALTGLPNRAALIRGLGDAITAARRDATAGALIFLDLDGFKAVNDAYGHDIGDRLLRSVAAGFNAVCGDRVIARVGGDEFAIILVDQGATQAALDLSRLLTRYLSQPFDIDGRVIVVGTSIGIAAIDGTIPSAEEALRRADVAMYQAKQQGRNRAFVYDASIDITRHQRLEIAADLRKALRSGKLELAYQPTFDATTRRIVGAEALLRWPTPGKIAIPPSVFIPIAEETGLIDELGAWTLREACKAACDWPNVHVAVNVSPAQFRNPNFDALLSTILAETRLPAHALELEVTETYLVANPAQARRSINAIRNLGVSVALDDFGTGFSSVGYLRSFTFDKLKLDRSLIAGIATDQRAQRFVQATIALAESLDLEVSAEGVESEDEALLLRLAGCREFQGFFFAMPCSAAEFTELLGRADGAEGSLTASA
jgi:diguanylate cyclase (GGDEF)-like protein